MSWYPTIRNLLFRMEAEHSHDFALTQLSRLGRSPLRRLLRQSVPSRPVRCLGLDFPNPVGLAAGLDKNGACLDALAELGFGFLEVGTVTPKPQEGNPKPRLFRLPEHEALINRMGFNNLGVDNLVRNIEQSQYHGVLGINIGKNKTTPDDQAVGDYLYCMRKVYPWASYITVNISSPNTPGLRAFQHGAQFRELLAALKECQYELNVRYERYVPVLIKIAPDLTATDVRDLAQVLTDYELDGVIATNTTINKQSVADHPAGKEQGGLSGAPLAPASHQIIKWLRQELPQGFPIIGVGGIRSAEDAHAKLAAGADLVQIYTGFIYEGPKLIRAICDSWPDTTAEG